MKKILSLIALCSAVQIAITGCAYNTIDEKPAPAAGNDCDNTKIFTYKADIQAILNDQGCEGCHRLGGTSPNLSDSTQLRNYINSKKSTFIASIEYSGSYPMPKGGPEMPDSLQNKIKVWICQGMK